MTLGERISNLRKDCNYSQEYIAESLGVSRQAVSKWEKDLSSPDTENLIKLSELLNTSVQFLATGKDYYFPEGKPVTENKRKPFSKKQIFSAVAIILFIPILIYLLLGIFSSVDYDINHYNQEKYGMRYEDFLSNKYSDKLTELVLEEIDNEFYKTAIVDAYSYTPKYNGRKTLLNTHAYIETDVGNHYQYEVIFERTRIWFNTYIWKIYAIYD